MNTIKHILLNYWEYFNALVDNGGPIPKEYDRLLSAYTEINSLVKEKLVTRMDLLALWKNLGPAFYSKDTMQALALYKPYGYAGDFEVIDRIYTKWVSPDPKLENWDHFFHSQKAPEAVRNRIPYFHNIIDSIYVNESNKPIRILNLGVGPGRCVYSYLSKNPHNNIFFDSVDHDRNAIEYAKALNRNFSSSTNFILGNLKSFKSDYKYDLVWCAGIFDYLPDGLFRALLPRLLKHVAKNGLLVLGNFSENNPTRDYMECGEWFLYHRSESKLKSLAMDSGINLDSVSIGDEPEKVNLFMHIRI